jgi:hypothetical protein
VDAVQDADTGGILTLLNLFSGGALLQLTVFALGIEGLSIDVPPAKSSTEHHALTDGAGSPSMTGPGQHPQPDRRLERRPQLR